MAYTTLVEAAEVARHLDDPDWVIADCRFSLEDTTWGKRAYLEAHIPGAVYAHLDEDLCGPIIPGQTGRHPLPPIEQLVEKFSRWGIDEKVQVVAYDDAGGAMAAARLWWLLRWLGHDSAAVLNGGWSGWRQQGFPQRGGEEGRQEQDFTPRPVTDMVAMADEILNRLGERQLRLFDVRSPDRYRGENEPIDPVAGHIPGAISAPYKELLSSGRLLPPDEIRARFAPILDDEEAPEAIFYCGSGVTAALSVLAVAHAGLGLPRLYPGSWSEWINDPGRPIETGQPPG